MSLILSRRDVDFLLYEWLDVAALLARERFAAHDKEVFDAVIDLAETIAQDHFAPHNKKADAHEPRFENGEVILVPEVKAALDIYLATGLIAASKPASAGGMQLPVVVDKAASAFLIAANPSTFGYPTLTIAAANLLLVNGTPAQIERYARPMIDGRFFGTMCLSESQAGSSVGDITTRAEPQPDGSYRLFGNKMWISAGEHALAETIIHLVLARVPGGPPGVKGISLFLVPRDLLGPDGDPAERNDVVFAGLNHKMGNRGTTNCLLNFGEGFATPEGRAGAVGNLVGELHGGLAAMFTMMNESRIVVGIYAAATGYTGYLHALDYARGRRQGRPPGAKDPTQPQVPLVRHADVRRMLLAQKSYVEAGLALNLYCARLIDEQASAADLDEQREAEILLDLLTPIAKSWPSQWCLAANDLAIQVHGGCGYTREYNVEQFYRDNRLNPIHEGTHGIQGIDLLGRKVAMQQGAALDLFGARVGQTVAAARGSGSPELTAWARRLQGLWTRVVDVTALLQAQANPELRLANASVYLEAFGHVTMLWVWVEQALAAQGKCGAFYEGKRAAARYFHAWEAPKVDQMLDLLAVGERTPFDCDPDWL